MADLLLENRKIVTVGKNRQRKRIPETRDSWKDSHQNGHWESLHDDVPGIGVHMQPTPRSFDWDIICRRRKVRLPSIEE